MGLIPNPAIVSTQKYSISDFISLGWIILKHKCLYEEFAGDCRFDHMRIDDAEFDSICATYNKIAKKLKQEPSATNMVGFNKNTGSGSAVLAKILLDAHNNKRTIEGDGQPVTKQKKKK